LHLALHGRGQSVHLCEYPKSDPGAIDARLESTMEIALAVASIGRAARESASVRVRQPLARVLIHGDDEQKVTAFLEDAGVLALVLDELNVKNVSRAEGIERYVTLSPKPNFPALGKRFGKRVPVVAKAIKSLDVSALLELRAKGEVNVTIDGDSVAFGRDEIGVEVAPVDGFGAGEQQGVTVIVDLQITDALRVEGAAREIVNRLQKLRKSAGLEVTDRIRVRHTGADEVFASKGDLIAGEALAVDIAPGPPDDWPETIALEVGGEPVQLWITKTD